MINIHNLNFSYSKKGELFKELCLEAKEGSIIGLLGKNGAGKSTLLKLVAGLLSPQNGQILVDGHLPIQRKPAFLKQIYVVPEEFATPPITMQNYIKATSPFYPNFDHEKMQNLLQEFDLDGTKNLSKQSYGQKKKFLIAFALATNCKLLLLDEPTNGLDIPSKSLFRRVMAGALSEEQLVLISTHQVMDVENLIDRIVLVDNGKIIFNNSVYDISERYAFMTETDICSKDILYHELAPGGYRVIKNKNGVDTPLDIELLFNAISSGTKIESNEPSI